LRCPTPDALFRSKATTPDLGCRRLGNDPNGQRCSERSPRSIIDVIHLTNPADDALSANPPLAAASKKVVFQQ
jgi:hypothetical protein